MGKNEINIYSSSATSELQYSGVDPGFQVRGAHLIKLHRVEGGAKIFGVFCVKNHDFMPKNLIFSNFRGEGGRWDASPWICPWYFSTRDS